MKPSRVMTFDCYGTLIDWETGIRNAFRSAMLRTGASQGLESKAFELYEEEERRVERERPHLLYRDVLSRTSLSVARKLAGSFQRPSRPFSRKSCPLGLLFLTLTLH